LNILYLHQYCFHTHRFNLLKFPISPPIMRAEVNQYMDQKELRAKSLEIAVLIRGGSKDSPLDKYLPLAGEIEAYINGPPGIKPKSSYGSAPITGV
jgi:hypothetical protein